MGIISMGKTSGDPLLPLESPLGYEREMELPILGRNEREALRQLIRSLSS